ncbi:MAG: 3-hydroxyacyl-CoA dehydrogenase [Bacillota bacterium]
MKLIGVVGAGTMGAGIAQVAAQAGYGVVIYDIGPAPLEVGLGRIRSGLERLAQRGKLSQEERSAIMGRIATTTALGDFAEVDFVIEAAPEVLELKREIFVKLDKVCKPGVVLATNTSSLSVTQISALAGRRELVVGMHFFNPVPAMKLVEVVEGADSSAAAITQTVELSRAMGKTPVRVKDTPGFVVNRIARPFPGEALRLLGENVAGVRQIDRIVRMAGGFRMGPFELMDLVGMDINFAVNRSVFEQFFYEPRFRPHPLQERMVKANRLGRKTGAGWYRYQDGEIVDGPQGAEFFGNPGPRLNDVHRVAVLGAPDMEELVEKAGYRIADCCADADLVIIGDPELLVGREPKPEALVLVEASTLSTTEIAGTLPYPERVVGYGGVPSVLQRQLVEVAPGFRTRAQVWQRAVKFIHSLGRDVEVIHDGPGLVAPRIIACLVNEAAFALQEGIASVDGIDTAMRLGVNYPNGPLDWADTIGPDVILRVLEGLHQQTGEDRYRPCSTLRKVVAAGGSFYELFDAGEH